MVITVNKYVNFKAVADSAPHTAVYYRDDGSGNARWVYTFLHDGAQVVYGDLSSVSTTITQFTIDFPASVEITENFQIA